MARTSTTRLLALDVACLSGLDTAPGVYVAADSAAEGWQGCTVFARLSTDHDWIRVGEIRTRCGIGSSAAALGTPADPWTWDEGSSIEAAFVNPGLALASVSDEAVYRGLNRAVVGTEVVAWRTATASALGWTLTGLLRGRGGTEQEVGEHLAGEDVVLIPTAGLLFVPIPLDRRGTLIQLRASSIGEEGVYSAPVGIRPVFRNLTPWAPVGLASSRAEDGAITMTWTRRARFGGDLLDGQDAPLCETDERYEVDILDGASEPSVLRTISSRTASAIYTAEEQTEDGLTPGDPVDVAVYQISNLVRRGWPLSGTA